MTTGTYQPVQTREDFTNVQFVRHSMPGYTEIKATLLQDAGRSTDLEPLTLLSKVAASQKWTPFIDETATDGTAIPQGIYFGPAIVAADIVAGDIPNIPVITAGIKFDEELLIIENSKTLETVIGATTIHARTVRDYLRGFMLVPAPTIEHSGGAN